MHICLPIIHGLLFIQLHHCHSSHILSHHLSKKKKEQNNWAPYLRLFNICFTRILTKSFEVCPCDFYLRFDIGNQAKQTKLRGTSEQVKFVFFLTRCVRPPVIFTQINTLLFFWLKYRHCSPTLQLRAEVSVHVRRHLVHEHFSCICSN